MPWHIVIRLPGQRIACADHREPVAGPMHKINDALSHGKTPDPALYDAVAAWLGQHPARSAICHAGLSPSGLPCGHD